MMTHGWLSFLTVAIILVFTFMLYSWRLISYFSLIHGDENNSRIFMFSC